MLYFITKLFILNLFIHRNLNAGTDTNSDDINEHEHDHTIEFLMIFIIFGIMISIILSGIKNKTGIPYTPMLLIVGLIIGSLSEWLWVFGDSM